jgi:hypothetical protein
MDAAEELMDFAHAQRPRLDAQRDLVNLGVRELASGPQSAALGSLDLTTNGFAVDPAHSFREHSYRQTLIRADDLAAIDGKGPTGVGGHSEVIQRLSGRTAHDVPVRVELASVAPADESLRRPGPRRLGNARVPTSTEWWQRWQCQHAMGELPGARSLGGSSVQQPGPQRRLHEKK